MAKRFFKNAEISAKITGVNLNLITKLGNILIAMSSGYEINIELFDQYCKETAELYIKLYNWYRMPPSMHNILMHGSMVIQFALFPIGQLSEEAQESRNKDYSNFRENNTRKMSRISTNTNLMYALLISSDPVISSKRKILKLPTTHLSTEVKNVLIINEETEEMSTENSESDSE